ncbi:Macrocin O-methyltransferase [Posidoniimonas polymericola]|uniref:Macrocin O-methyltransferase n=1 Tax=Posidoniimonas polymericola TaxID=2528002 RepID=A0A5C5YM53_9BACT|nr:TylF/MycF/NovP-related O-methyltransferase [Posidoniimonas polymericola]TWT75899.1 Macrocin O-methyltransferase [Posidoniimonas polymericola]
MWLRNKIVQRMGGGGFMEQVGLDAWSMVQMASLASRKPGGEVKLLRKVRRERKCLNSAWECYNVMTLARAMSRLPGSFAEVGCYQGTTAKLMCEVKGDKPLMLFDTFEGLPQDCDKDARVHSVGQYACSMEKVSGYLAEYDNVTYHKGLFPDSAADVPEQQYAFAHFDVDLYEGTLGCLEYFYPRMTPGGVMLSHDYGMLKGVEQAFHDFMADKPEPIIPQATTQVMIIKQAGVAAAVEPTQALAPAMLAPR